MAVSEMSLTSFFDSKIRTIAIESIWQKYRAQKNITSIFLRSIFLPLFFSAISKGHKRMARIGVAIDFIKLKDIFDKLEQSAGRRLDDLPFEA